MSNRVNKLDFVPDEPFYDKGYNHGQFGSKSFCSKCFWNSTWDIPHENCDGKIYRVPASIRFPKKKASKRTWKVFAQFLIRKKKPTPEELINMERFKTLNQTLWGGKKYRKDKLK